jgi:flagellar biosynthesis protein FlhF
MKIKKFRAKTFSDALKLVKKELNEDALILATEEKKGLRPYVEVTAAVDYDLKQKIEERDHESDIPEQKKVKERQKLENTDMLSDAQISDLEFENSLSSESHTIMPELTTIKNKIEDLRSSLMEMKNIGYEISLPPQKRTIYHFLRERAFQQDLALLLCKRARDIKEIPSLILSDIKSVKKHGDAKKAVLLIGPTGVGKTTTIAKLAAKAIKSGRKVAILNYDSQRIGAVEQIKIYSKIMGIPLSNVSNTTDLKKALSDLSTEKDIIFIDSTGKNPKDDSYINGLLEVYHSKLPIEIHLLMSAHYDEEFLMSAYRFYKKLPITCIGITKTDEAVRFGSIYNLIFTYQKPVIYVTTGQVVPNDIKIVTPEEITKLIVNYSPLTKSITPKLKT